MQIFNNSKVPKQLRKILPGQLLPRWGDRFLMLPISPCSQNSLWTSFWVSIYIHFIILLLDFSTAKVLWGFLLAFSALSMQIFSISVILGINRLYVPHLKGYTKTHSEFQITDIPKHSWNKHNPMDHCVLPLTLKHDCLRDSPWLLSCLWLLPSSRRA